MSLIRPRKIMPVPVDQRSFDLLSLSVTLVLAVNAEHLPWWLSLALAFTLGWRWWQRRQRRSDRMPRWIKLPLLALLTLAVIVHYGNLFGRAPGTALAIGLLVLKLLETETRRDVRVGVSFACFTLMTALLFNQGLVNTVFVALGLLPALATLRALEPAQPPTTVPSDLLSPLALLAAALPLALFAFVLVPRLSSPLWGAPARDQARTGLSDHMSPGGFTELLTDDRPAMRVTFDGAPPPPDQRYFRAYVMARYDGVSWTYSAVNQPNPRPALLDVSHRVTYQITLLPTHRRLLPTLDVPIDTPAGALMSQDRVVMAAKPVSETRTYGLSSATEYRLQPRLDDPRRRWLQLPVGFNPRTLALGQSWRQRYGHDDAAIVRAALNLFHDGGFRYTLTPAPLGRDAMDDFLFDTREGFCEHYSSAFT
ncbi:MAG: DUF3488 domain-containing protein, partial [Rhodanobacter sp.]